MSKLPANLLSFGVEQLTSQAVEILDDDPTLATALLLLALNKRIADLTRVVDDVRRST